MRPMIHYRPGDLVHLQMGKSAFAGVILKLPNPLNNNQFASIMSNGKVMHHRSNQILYSLPKWSENIFEKIWKDKQELIVDNCQLSIKKEQERQFLSAFRKFLDQVEEKQLKAAKNNQVRKFYKECIKKGVKVVTMDDLATKILNVKDPSHLDIYCIRRLIENDLYFIPTNDQSIRVRPLEESSKLRSMIYKKLKSGSSLHKFLRKCRMIISSYRKGKYLKIDFDQTDLDYIQILKNYLESSALNHSVEKKAVLVGIIGNIGLYNQALAGRDTVIQLLKEIGVFSKNHDPSLHFPINEGKLEYLPFVSSEGDKIYKQSEFHSQNIIDMGVHKYPSNSFNLLSNTPSFSKDYQFSQIISSSEPFSEEPFSKDPLESFRKECVDPVFVIDSEKAHELDDGISIEETPEGLWIHVHIANPTSYIPSHHPLANISQLRGLSVYLPHMHFPMMPPQLSKYILNLGASQGTLCFSARLGSAGDIVDYKITPMLVKRPRFISYTKADSILSWEKITDITKLDLNPPWIKEHLEKSFEKIKSDPCTNLNDHEMKSLQMIQKLMQKHRSFRLSKGAIIYGGLDYSISIKEADLPIASHSSQSSFEGESFRTQSTIELNPFAASHRSPSQVMVEEAMIIAGRVAAKYCQDRSLPVSFRGQLHPFEGCMEKYQNRELANPAAKLVNDAPAYIDPISGTIADDAYQRLIPFQSSAFASLNAHAHFSMGIEDGYVKATSPLRRFQDMHTHYQIQASILGTKLPFSSDATAQIIQRQEVIHKKTRSLQNVSKRYWMLEFLRRQSFRESKSLIAKDLGFGINAFRPYDRKDHGKENLHTAIVIKADYSGKYPEVMVSLPYLGGFRSFITPRNHVCEVGDEITVLVDCVAPDRGFLRLIEI